MNHGVSTKYSVWWNGVKLLGFFGVISFETKLVSRYIFKRIFFEKKNGFFSFILFLQFSLLICPFCLTCSPFRLYIPLYLFPVSLLLFSFFFVFSLTSFPLCLSLLLRSFSFPSSPISNPFCLAPFYLFFLFFFLSSLHFRPFFGPSLPLEHDGNVSSFSVKLGQWGVWAVEVGKIPSRPCGNGM